MKTVLVILCVCVIHSSYATNYYFSAASGDDTRTAFEAQHPATPWKTLAKLNSLFGSLLPGDSVLLKRGDTFYGSILVNRSGTPAEPIIVGAFGQGAKPIINSFIALTGWISKGKGIWESTDPSLASTINMVLFNGIEYAMGRYPNADVANKGYLNFESHVDTTSITDKQLSTAINWKGAELVLRPRHWALDRDLITSHTGTKISYINGSRYEPYENYGYFIQNSIKTLDKFGEWYFDPSTKKFSAYFGSAKPSSYVIEASTIKNVIYSFAFSNIVFDDLTIKGANGSGFSIIGGSNITVQNCDILFSGQKGINVVKHKGFNIQNCLIANQNNNGIDLEGDNAIVRNNKIMNTYLLAGMGRSGNGTGIGLSISSNNSIVEFNEIRNTGYQGIYFNGSDVVIKNNLIDSFCLTKDDGGGIYSTKGAVDYERRKVIGNIILNGRGIGYGTNDSAKTAAHGIYVDNNASPVDFRDNTIANCSNNGINIHSVFGMTMENNTVFNNKVQLNIIEDVDHAAIRNCTISNNILFSKLSTQYVSMLASAFNDIKSFGKFDSNYYARPLDEKAIIYSKANSSIKSSTQIFDLPAWKLKYGMDMHSRGGARQLSRASNPNNYIRFEYNATTADKSVSLGGNYVDVAGKIYSNSITLKPFASAVLIKTSGTIGNAAPFVNLTSPLAGAGFNAPASVVITADAADDGSVAKVDFYSGSTLLGSDKTSPYSYTWNNVAAASYTLTAKATDNTGLVTSSKPVTISVIKKVTGAPTVSITGPTGNASFIAPGSINITASAADAGGSIAKVQFYSGTTLLGTDNTSPYSFKWSNVAVGSYSLTAKAADNSGLTTTSAVVAVSVVKTKTQVAPVVNITAPANNATYTASATGATITVSATASDTDGSITKIEFFNGSTLLKTGQTPSFSYKWQSVPAGNYTITCKVTDNSGLTTISSPIKITVKPPLASRSSSTQVSAATPGTSGGISNNRNDREIINDKLLSPSDYAKLAKFKLFPNPAFRTIQIYFDRLATYQAADVTIQNTSGTMLKKYPVILTGNKINVDISSLSSGIYIMGLSINNFKINKKFIKN